MHWQLACIITQIPALCSYMHFYTTSSMALTLAILAHKNLPIVNKYMYCKAIESILQKDSLTFLVVAGWAKLHKRTTVLPYQHILNINDVFV